MDEIRDRLNNPAEDIDKFTLYRWTRELETAATSEPPERRSEILSALGMTYARLENIPASLAAHERAASYAPSESEHECNIASCLATLGRHREALEHIARARAAPRLSYDLRIILGVNECGIRTFLGETGAARATFESVAGLISPGDARHNLRLANHAASVGYDGDAVEFLARHLLALTGTKRDADQPAEEALLLHVAAVDGMAGIVHLSKLAGIARRAMATWVAETAEEDRLDAEELRDALAEFKDGGERTFTLDEVLAGHGLTRADLSR
jgi:tetratricopeptide (TPR) repeat protein